LNLQSLGFLKLPAAILSESDSVVKGKKPVEEFGNGFVPPANGCGGLPRIHLPDTTIIRQTGG
jgi:hypothetical protein